MLITSVSLILVAFTSATNAIAVNGNPLEARGASLKDSCGKGQVINTTTLYTADGQDMKVTIESCEYTPSSTYNVRELLGLEKRRIPSVCHQSCVQSCHFNGTPAPNCASLISTINSRAGQKFIARPGTRTIIQVGACEVSFSHSLSVPVEACYSWMSPLVSTMNQCLNMPPNNEGECFQGNAAFSWLLLLAKSGTF